MKVLRPVLTLVVVALPLALASSAVERAQAARPVVTLTVAPDAFSPNGDHVKEIVRIAAHVDQPSRVVLDFAHQGVTIFSSRAVVTMRPKTLHFVWKGRTRLGGRGLAGPLSPPDRPWPAPAAGPRERPVEGCSRRDVVDRSDRQPAFQRTLAARSRRALLTALAAHRARESEARRVQDRAASGGRARERRGLVPAHVPRGPAGPRTRVGPVQRRRPACGAHVRRLRLPERLVEHPAHASALPDQSDVLLPRPAGSRLSRACAPDGGGAPCDREPRVGPCELRLALVRIGAGEAVLRP